MFTCLWYQPGVGEGSTEVADSLVGPGSKAACQAGVCRGRTLGQLIRGLPAVVAKVCQHQKHTLLGGAYCLKEGMAG